MSLIIDIFQGTAAVGALMFGYVKLSAAEKISAHSLLKRGAALSGMRFIVAVSVWHVTKFSFDDGLLIRRKILWLLLNLWNMIIHTILGVVLFVYLRKQPLRPSVEVVEGIAAERDSSDPK